MVRLQGFLTRNTFPHHLLDPAADPEAAELIARHAPAPDELPLVVCPDGTVLRSPTEAALARQLGMIGGPREEIVYDGGSSAGQAAVFLSGHARKVRMVVRGSGLAATMSRYLIDRIAAASNIEVMVRTEIVGLHGTAAGSKQGLWRDRTTGAQTTGEIGNVFLFVGADPATGWLDGCGVALDRTGFVITDATPAGGQGRAVPALESSIPGVFAVGDVRSESVKRVGGAIGEGAQEVAALHVFLADAPAPTP